MTTATATRAYRRNQPPKMDVTVSACRACGGEGVQAWEFGAPQESERCLGRANVTVGQVCVECGGVSMSEQNAPVAWPEELARAVDAVETATPRQRYATPVVWARRLYQDARDCGCMEQPVALTGRFLSDVLAIRELLDAGGVDAEAIMPRTLASIREAGGGLDD